MVLNTKKEILKDIIRKLHQGLSADEAKGRFEREIGAVTSGEIAEMEQSLINEGLSPDEIKKFCNVHALIFRSALEKAASTETSPAHPIYLFKLENRQIEKLTQEIKAIIARKDSSDLAMLKKGLQEVLLRLKGVETHYERKEQLLFPFLEKYGFMGPSKVMWGKHNEVRELFRGAFSGLQGLTEEGRDAYIEKTVKPLVEEVDGMIFKEENILFPTSLEKLQPGDWVDILKESDEIGYVFIEKPAETEALVKNLKESLHEEAVIQDSAVAFPSGQLQLNELLGMLNTLPAELTFVDRQDTVRYFSEARERIFHRTRSVIGRRVQNCHPPQSVDVVEKILASFKEGQRDSADFWINYRGKLVYIRYFAVRDRNRNYLGSLEVVQNITPIRELKGEKRLLDERA